MPAGAKHAAPLAAKTTTKPPLDDGIALGTRGGTELAVICIYRHVYELHACGRGGIAASMTPKPSVNIFFSPPLRLFHRDAEQKRGRWSTLPQNFLKIREPALPR